MGKQTCVYIVGNKTGVLYVGVTSDLADRMEQHKTKAVSGFSSKYGTDRLLFFEVFEHPIDALRAEKMIKGWRRSKKLDLIRTINPTFRDLTEDVF
ncbi:MAG: GIY-YIG nuclease family protein [Anaerolineales bacterium]|nr:GIY-YIG nuclease family protein [Anaerolineales bacterium]